MLGLKMYVLRKRLESTIGSLIGSARKLLQPLGLSQRPLMTAALIVLFLVMCLAICGCTPRTVRPNLPPQADPRPVPQFEGQTYRDAILYLIEVREAAFACEMDKAAIRQVYGHE